MLLLPKPYATTFEYLHTDVGRDILIKNHSFRFTPLFGVLSSADYTV